MKTSKAFLLGFATLAVAAAASGPFFFRGRGVHPLLPLADIPSAQFKREESAALFVGVRKFSHDEILDVPYAVDDAVDLAYMFAVDPRVHLVPPDRVVLALSGPPQKRQSQKRLEELKGKGATVERATQPDIIQQLQRQTDAAGPDGILVVSLATHGFVREGVPYVLGATSLFGYPETSLSAARIFEIASTTKARRSLLFVDACRERITGGIRSVSDPITAAPLISRMHLVDGQAIFYAAPSGGYAYDDPSGNGVFTKAVIDGLSCQATATRGVVTVGTLRTFVEREVRDWIRQYRDPTIDSAIQVTLDGDTHNMPLACCQDCPVPPGEIARIDVVDATVSAFDAKDELLWEWDAPAPIVRAELLDLHRDRSAEVVAGAGNRIVVLDRERRQQWSVAQGTALHAFAVAPEYRKRPQLIVALFDDAAIIYSTDGGLHSTYDHPGLRHIVIDRPTNLHAPKIALADANTVVLLDSKKFARGTEVWAGDVTPSSERIVKLDVVDYDGNGRREIRVTTASGGALFLDFEGRLIAAREANTSPPAPRWHLRARTPRAGKSRASESGAERR